jgi:hypothetical protein
LTRSIPGSGSSPRGCRRHDGGVDGGRLDALDAGEQLGRVLGQHDNDLLVRPGDVVDVLDVVGVGFEGFAEGVAFGDLPRRVGVGAVDGSELRAVQGLRMVVRVPSA